MNEKRVKNRIEGNVEKKNSKMKFTCLLCSLLVENWKTKRSQANQSEQYRIHLHRDLTTGSDMQHLNTSPIPFVKISKYHLKSISQIYSSWLSLISAEIQERRRAGKKLESFNEIGLEIFIFVYALFVCSSIFAFWLHFFYDCLGKRSVRLLCDKQTKRSNS